MSNPYRHTLKPVRQQAPTDNMNEIIAEDALSVDEGYYFQRAQLIEAIEREQWESFCLQ